MSHITLKIVQLSHQVKKDGTCPILFRLTKNRKPKYIKSGYYVKPSQFKEGTENWVSKHPDAAIINAAIEKKRSDMMANIINADIAGIDIEVSTVTGKKATGTSTIFGAITSLIQSYELKKQVAAYNRLTTNLGYLKKAWGKDILVSELSRVWVDKYINYRYSKGNSVSTIKKNLMDLSVALKVIEYPGVNYFEKCAKGLKPQPVQRKKLTAEDITSLENGTLTGLYDLARDMFLFSFYTHGMRFESMATLSVNDIKGNLIVYRMNKGKKVREIEIHSKLARIIDKYKPQGNLYLFPAVKEVPDIWTKKDIVGAKNALLNKYLKGACIMLGIDKEVSFHMARHTFATLSLYAGVDYSILKDALGHTNFSTTQGYLKSLSDDKVNKALRVVYGEIA